MTDDELFENVACDICGSTRQHVLYRYLINGSGANIVKCENCHCTYLCPRPKPYHLSQFYGDNYYSFRLDQHYDLNLRNPKDALRRTVMKHHFGYTNIDAHDTWRIPPALSA